MQRSRWTLTLSTAVALLACGLFGTPAKAATKAVELGSGPAYEALGQLAVLHQGRVKPLDTMARHLIKQIYGAEEIKLLDADGHPAANWGHVGAFFDFAVRPQYWDEQDIIRVNSVALKQRLLAEPLKKKLAALAEDKATSAADRDKLLALAKADVITARDLTDLAQAVKLPDAERRALALQATRLSSGYKWLSPHDLEEGRVTVEGKLVPFEMWLMDISRRSNSDELPANKPKLPEIEKRAFEAGVALRHYEALRGDTVSFIEPLDLIIPRPNTAAYIKFSGDVQEKIVKSAHEGAGDRDLKLTPLERDAANVLAKYLDDLPRDDWKVPGTDAKFDARFASWLGGKSAWVPLRVIMETDPAELAKAGFGTGELEAFRSAYTVFTTAEEAQPGRVDLAKAEAVVKAARALGDQVSAYPTAAVMTRETHFNAFAPFYKAAWAYAFALALLLLCVGISSPEPHTTSAHVHQTLYLAGMAGLLGGIALEIYGFYFRVRISGWAPVTNMYETVIWVALMAPVLGVALELIYKRTYPALAATMVALLATILACKVPLLDADIKNIPPVLRSNYWLTIHVLTIVSSYAAFALVWALGLIATAFYLTASYKRDVPFKKLAAPLALGVPLLVAGSVVVSMSYTSPKSSWLATDAAYYLSCGFAGLGGVLTIACLGSLLGEMLSRARMNALLRTLPVQAHPVMEEPASAAANESGGVATLTRSSVAAEIRARSAAGAGRPVLGLREQAMQNTAGKIKPVSNLIYRAMQVGVLLVAAGTMLGGFWADVSWGRFWGWDPKEVWALITLLVYLIPLHGRFAGWINTFGLVVASVACFLSVVMAWYGVNFVLGVGLHSYGFTEGGGQGIVLSACAAVLAVVVAAAWRRSLGQRSSAAVVAS